MAMANNDEAAEELGKIMLALCGKEDSISSVGMESLIDRGANVNTKGKGGKTILMSTVLNGHLEQVEILLAVEGIDIDAKDRTKITAFMYACMCGRVEIVEALLAALEETSNFDINAKDSDDFTALMLACVNSNVEVVELLLSISHTRIHLKNKRGKTALDCVKGSGRRRIEYEMMALFKGEFLPYFQKQIMRAALARIYSPPLFLTLYLSLNSHCSTCFCHSCSP
jgi:ankyrin repeat protein